VKVRVRVRVRVLIAFHECIIQNLSVETSNIKGICNEYERIKKGPHPLVFFIIFLLIFYYLPLLNISFSHNYRPHSCIRRC